MDWKKAKNRTLVAALLALKNAEEAESFLRDLLTPKEIEEFSKRLEAAHMLSESVPYSAIEKKTGLSSTTVARVAHWLRHGMGGYGLVLKRLKH